MTDNLVLKELVVENESLIYSIVKKFHGDTEDLFQVGVCGLIRAYYNYNEKFNTKFSTYAYQYIFGEIYQYVLKNKNIKVSNDQVKLNSAINKATDYLTQKFGRLPSDYEVATFLEIPVNKIDESRVFDTVSLDYDDDKLYNFISINEDNKDELIMLRDALNKLSNGERELILKRYFYNMTQSELASELGVNQVKVSREEGKILVKLRQNM